MEKEGSVRESSEHGTQRKTPEHPISKITGKDTVEYQQTKLQRQRRDNKGENREMRRYAGNELRKAREKKCPCHKDCDTRQLKSGTNQR
jgi:hypothetical protein